MQIVWRLEKIVVSLCKQKGERVAPDRATRSKTEKDMKASEILKQVVYLNCTEQQGTAVSGLFETFTEFVERYFGSNASIVAGGFKNDREYFYSYCEPLKDIADMIIEADGCRIWVYEVE